MLKHGENSFTALLVMLTFGIERLYVKLVAKASLYMYLGIKMTAMTSPIHQPDINQTIPIATGQYVQVYPPIHFMPA